MTPIEDFIMSQEDHQEILSDIYHFIKSILPEAEEGIAYGMPTFKMKKNIIHFMTYKDHIGFYPGAKAIQEFEKDLQNYHLSKGTIRVTYNQVIPWHTIKAIVEFNLNQYNNPCLKS